MKKKEIKKIALLGLSTGLLLSAQAQLSAENNPQVPQSITKEALVRKCGGGCGAAMRKCGGGCGAAMRKCGGGCGAAMRKCGGGCGGLMRRCGGGCGAAMRKCGANCGGLTAATEERSNPSSTMDLPDQSKNAKDQNDSNYGNMGYHLMTEEELTMELDNKGREMYNKLDKKGKELARYVASQRCNGTNMCAGLNACATERNKCAGQGACKGTGKCAFADKNLAVKIVSQKMASKRNGSSAQ